MHVPVLEKEVLKGLNLRPHSIVIDATINGGGHAEAMTRFLDKTGTLIGLDLDKDVLLQSRRRLSGAACTVILKQANYRYLDKVLDEIGIENVHAILFDLGMSSLQLEESGRGFSFQKDEPLLMTFKPAHDLTIEDLTAQEIVNTWEEEHLAEIIYGFGEERFSKRIAHAIILRRAEHPIGTTYELVECIESAIPEWYRHRKIHHATKTFQALRIAVNNEFDTIKEGLQKALERLAPKGRIVVIAFHSIEDRLVKHFFKEKDRASMGMIITKKPIVPSCEEIKRNPRARSAKLRIFETC